MFDLCLFVFLSLIVIGHAVVLDTFMPFSYQRNPKFMFRRAGDEGCVLCFGGGDNCIAMNSYRCDYYIATADIREEVDQSETASVPVHVPELRIEVDTMMFNLLTRAAADPQYKECVPLVSHYTDCTKENVCIGCKVCECAAEGRWNCSTIQKCRPDATKLHVDHKTLVTILETIRNGHRYRVKRSDASQVNKTETIQRISYADMSEWVYGVRPDPKPLSTTEANKDMDANLKVNDTEIDKIVFADIVTENPEEASTTLSNETIKIKLDEIKQWLNKFQMRNSKIEEEEANTYTLLVTTSTAEEALPHNVTQRPEPNSNESNVTEESLVFDDVLNSLNIENKNNTRRKPPLAMNENRTDIDYINYDDSNANSNQFNNLDINEHSKQTNDQDKNLDTFDNPATSTNTVINTALSESATLSNTETVVDLLQSAKEKIDLNYRNGKNIVFTDYFDQNGEEYKPKLNDLNDINDNLNAVNVMKRDVRNVKTETITPSPKVVTPQNFKKNISDSVFDYKTLQYYVLYPLTNMLNEKQKEFDELMNMRQNLLKVINTYRTNEVDNMNETKLEMVREPSLIRSKLEVSPEFKINLRAGNTSLLDKYMLKLKHDIYEVIRDIVGIQKLSDPTIPSEDMKFLIKAMKHYIHRQGFHKKNSRLDTMKSFRRNIQTIESEASNYVKDSIVKIVDTVDKNMPLANGLKPLSRDARKILNRIIKNNYVDEFAVIGLRAYDPHYNLTNDLRNIGTKWQVQMTTIKDCKPADQLYAMKLLHLELSTDIIKMNDALALINFAHTRRMVPVEENVGEEIISKINNDLNDIQRKLIELIKQDRVVEPIMMVQTEIPHRKHKTSFFKQIKNLLRNSKYDIFGLLRKKVPKTEIFKELARKQLEELTRRKVSDYEKTMQKWQDNLGILESRHKRSVPDYEKVRNRIKNILPKYLRGKVNAVAAGKGSKKRAKKREDSTRQKKKAKNTTKTTGSTTTASEPEKATTKLVSNIISSTQNLKTYDPSTTTKRVLTYKSKKHNLIQHEAYIYKQAKHKQSTHKLTDTYTSTHRTFTHKTSTRKVTHLPTNKKIQQKLTTHKTPTHKKTTHKPTTHKLTTHIPTTHKPTTQKPTTHKPTTHIPTTHKRTAQKPTTQKPTTHRPTTREIIAHKPTNSSINPTNSNDKPTTQKPTTLNQTTHPPTTHTITTHSPTTHDTTIYATSHYSTTLNTTTHNTTHTLTSHSTKTQKVTTHEIDTNKSTTHLVSTQNLTTHEPITRIVSTVQPTTHEVTTQKPITHKVTIQKPITHQVITHNPTTHEVITHKSTTHKVTTHKITTHKATTHKVTTHKIKTHKPSTRKIKPRKKSKTIKKHVPKYKKNFN